MKNKSRDQIKKIHEDIHNLMEHLNLCINALDHEFGSPGSLPPKFVKHEHKLYSIKRGGKRFKFAIEVEEEP